MNSMDMDMDTNVNNGFETVDEQGGELIVPEPPTADPAQEPAHIIEAKIISLMTVYPVLNPSMIQAGLGPSLPAALWRPVLQDLLAKKTLYQWEQPAPQQANHLPSGRTRPYICVALTPKRQRAEAA